MKVGSTTAGGAYTLSVIPLIASTEHMPGVPTVNALSEWHAHSTQPDWLACSRFPMLPTLTTWTESFTYWPRHPLLGIVVKNESSANMPSNAMPDAFTSFPSPSNYSTDVRTDARERAIIIAGRKECVAVREKRPGKGIRPSWSRFDERTRSVHTHTDHVYTSQIPQKRSSWNARIPQRCCSSRQAAYHVRLSFGAYVGQ